MTSIIAARLLSPAGFGIWQSAKLVQQYGLYSSLGVGWGMHRLVPIAVAQNADDKTGHHTITNTAFSFSLLMTTLIGIGVLIVGPMISSAIPTSVYYLLSIAIITRQIAVLSDQLATSLERYSLAGLTNITTSVAGLVLGIGGMLAFGVEGLLLSQICWALLGFIMISRSLHLELRPMLDIDVLRELVGTGTQTIGNGLIMLGFKSLDRVAILAYLGTVALGYYGLALAAASLIEMIFQPIGRVTLQRSAAVYARSMDLRAVWRRVHAILIGQMVIFSILAGIFVLWLPAIVHFVLPGYEAGRAAASVLLFGVVAFSIRSTLVYFHLAIGKLMHTYPLQIALLIVGVAVVWLTMLWNPSLTAVAVAESCIFTLTSLAFAVYSLYLVDASIGFIFKSVALIILPVAYSSIMTVTLLNVMESMHSAESSVRLVILTIAFSAALLILHTPIFIFAERTTGLMSELTSLANNLLERARHSGGSQSTSEVSP